MPQDVHSPRQKGFLYSHVGWIFARGHDGTELTKIKDFARYPELIWLHRLELLPAVILAGLCFLIAGWPGLVVGFFCSTVLVYHSTFCINSLAHVCGSKRYLTGDDSRNNWLLAIMTMGEGWHNNHHAYQSSVRQGFRWWEVDVTFYILKMLSWLGVVWNLKSPPEEILRNEQRLGIRVINRAAAELAAQFNAQKIAVAISAALRGPELSQLREVLQHVHDRAAGVVSALHFPALKQLPSRAEFLAVAKSQFVKTISLDEIVDRAYELVLTSIGTHLATVEQPS
jgi:stearoyl-CoA desaturase (delta-9 desaturase)